MLGFVTEVLQQVEAFAPRSDDLSSILRSHKVAEESQLKIHGTGARRYIKGGCGEGGVGSREWAASFKVTQQICFMWNKLKRAL